MENMAADSFILSNQNALFINAKSSARAMPESSRRPLFATHELNRAIVTF